MTSFSPLERLRSGYVVDEASGCWIWQRCRSPQGYGLMRLNGPQMGAHRVAWLLLRGPIPDGLELDHLCRVRACVNPGHLEPVARRTNATRGVGWPGTNARKTHCPAGHPYAGPHLVINTYGYRVCRTCVNARQRERRRVRSLAA